MKKRRNTTRMDKKRKQQKQRYSAIILVVIIAGIMLNLSAIFRGMFVNNDGNLGFSLINIDWHVMGASLLIFLAAWFAYALGRMKQ